SPASRRRTRRLADRLLQACDGVVVTPVDLRLDVVEAAGRQGRPARPGDRHGARRRAVEEGASVHRLLHGYLRFGGPIARPSHARATDARSAALLGPADRSACRRCARARETSRRRARVPGGRTSPRGPRRAGRPRGRSSGATRPARTSRPWRTPPPPRPPVGTARPGGTRAWARSASWRGTPRAPGAGRPAPRRAGPPP